MMTNHHIILVYVNYWTNNLIGVAFIKYNYIENAESPITPTKIVKSK